MPTSTSRPKIVLTCLPHPARPALNLPIAAGYLKAAAYRFGLLDEVDVEILSPEIASYFGCRALVERIVAMKPALLGFTLFLWNVERSLYIAQEVKKQLPDIQIVAGGPEVSREAVPLLADPGLDIAVHGEGEMTFVDIVKRLLAGSPELGEIPGVSYRQDGKIVTTVPRPKIPDVELIPSPYLLGYLDPRSWAQMVIFTMRGCVLGCTYCLWSGRGRLRPFSLDRIREELMLAKTRDALTRVGIWDSAFNASPVFDPVCKMIREINPDKSLRCTCFLLAELVDEETARLLSEANFVQVDVGLQSSNPAVLANVGRRFDPTRFASGVKILEQHGMRVTVDTMLGLPGDSPSSFEDTIQFCQENKMRYYRIFNLSLGYGTAMRRQQAEFGLRIQPGPPYFVWETATFPRADLVQARKRHHEQCVDLSKPHELSYPAIVSGLPASSPENSGDSVSLLRNLESPIRQIVLRLQGPAQKTWLASAIIDVISERTESRLDLLYLGTLQTLQGSLWLIRDLLTRLCSRNPYLACNVLLQTDAAVIPQALLNQIRSFICSRVQFLDRREEVFSGGLPYAITRRANVLVITEHEPDGGQEALTDGSSYIRLVSISPGRPLDLQIDEATQASAGGLLVDFLPGSPMAMIRSAMDLLMATDKHVYFKDWVLQRIWDQNYIDFPSSYQSHCEVVIDQELNVMHELFDENELWVLSLLRRVGSNGAPEAWQAYTQPHGTGEA